MTCPNSTESGCRCVEHHPGLGVKPNRPVVLELVTAGPPEPSADERLDRFMQTVSEGCAACGGDPDRCREGQGEPTFARLTGCYAYSEVGEIRPMRAARAPRQPWEPKVA